MALHNMKHALNSTDDHGPGTTPNAGEFKIVATKDDATIVEITVEAPNPTVFTPGMIPERGNAGQLYVPTSPTVGNHATSKTYVDTVIASGPWKTTLFHSAVADHALDTVGDGATGGPALVVGDVVLNTTDKKYYTVTAGTGAGNVVTWNAGVKPTLMGFWGEKLTDATWQYDPDADVWVNKGATAHNRVHAITSPTDHSATAWRIFFSNAGGVITELPLGAKNTVLISGGANVNPLFSTLKEYPTLVICAGDTPVSSDFSAVEVDTRGLCKTSTGRYYSFFKDSVNVFATEMGSVVV